MKHRLLNNRLIRDQITHARMVEASEADKSISSNFEDEFGQLVHVLIHILQYNILFNSFSVFMGGIWDIIMEIMTL